MMKPLRFSALLVPASCLMAAAVMAAAPEKALKYHEALLKRPHNAALFDRFFGAWIDEQPVESLGEFLKTRAAANGGQDWTVLAIYQLRRGQEDKALETLGKAITALPDDAALPMERAKLYLRRLELEKARADLTTVAAGKDEILALEASKLIGKSWLREGRTDEAIKAWDSVLAAHPGDEDLLEDLVETAAAEAEMAQALVYIDQLIAVTRDPYQKTLRMMRRGDLLAQSGKTDEAVTAYAATLDKVGAGSWLEREVLAQIEKLFRKQDRIDDLGSELKKLAEAYPQRLAIHRQLAKLEAAQGEMDAAIGRFREVLKRSPGERELREEFIRMLSDGERFDDAVAELEKLIALAPADAELYLQVAAFRARQGKFEDVLAALKKAHELLGKDDSSGIRIASLMLQYGQKDPGEALLKQLAEAPGAGPVAMEVLASQYGQTQRKAEAVELLKKAGAGDDLDVLLRTTGAISALGESAVTFEVLMARANHFPTEPRFLSALAQAGMAAAKPVEVMPSVLKLVRLSKQAAELAENINLASRVIAAADKAVDVRASLEGQPTRTVAETCLLASLIETAGDFEGVEKRLTPETDPMAVHFHAALLDRRGEFDQAIAVLSRLATTDEGKKAAYFKDLSELQQRAGKTTEALATVERWKLAAPGDKAAWITGSRLLRESGKAEEAVKMTRQAVSRFEGDADLEASLAALHDEAGQWADSEAIYWRLYDAGQSPGDQARWGAQLAQLAQRTGKSAELEEKLQERARGNRRSIGPLMAQAELARVMNNEEKRRDLLLEAVRLQPKDLDLRMQIAEIEEKSGNPERVMAVLEEALPFDVNGRVRGALAQAYLRQGQAVKGMRELRLLSGKSGFDARSAESAAASLAGAKLYDEAIVLLRTELKEGGDWRTRYLLATLLEEDGREAEARPVFLSLLQAEGDIPSLVVPKPPNAQPVRNGLDGYPKEVRRILQFVSASQLGYVHRNQSRGGYYGPQGNSMVGPFSLPNTADDVRRLALVHLCSIGSRKSGTMDPELLGQIKAVGINDAGFVTDLVGMIKPDRNPDYFKLLEAHPDEPGLAEWAMMSGGMYGQTSDGMLFKRMLEHPEKLSPTARFNAWSGMVRAPEADEAAWTSWLAAAKAGVEGESADAAANISSQLVNFLQAPQTKLPDSLRPAVKALILAGHARNLKEHPEFAHSAYSLTVFSVAGTPEEWMEELNAVIRTSREKAGKSAGTGRSSYNQFGRSIQYLLTSMSRGYGSSSMGEIFKVPTIDTLVLRSLPPEVMGMLFAPQGSGYPKPSISLENLSKRSAQIESPLLRACLAVKAGDAAAIAKAMSATPPAQEAGDFLVLRAVALLNEKKPAAAFQELLSARTSGGGDREYSNWINFALLAVAGTMTPEERTQVSDQLQAILLQCRQSLGQPGAQILAAQAEALGLADLAKRLQPAGVTVGSPGAASTGPASIATVRGSSGRSGRSTAVSVDKLKKFVSEKKFDAAAREVLLGIRGQNPQTQPYYIRNELPGLIAVLGKEGKDALVNLLDPGDSKSLIRRLEYVDVCKAVGQPGKTKEVLEALMVERPEDAAVAARMIFALSPGDDDRWIQLMNTACKSEELVAQAGNYLAMGGRAMDVKEVQNFFDLVARWLEKADPENLAGANLTWITYYGKRFMSGRMTQGVHSLLVEEGGAEGKPAKEETEVMVRQKAVAQRLARAMVRHASCAEEGFRLLASSKAWTLEPAAKDDLARTAMLATSRDKPNEMSRRYGGVTYFQFQSNNGGTSDGEDLAVNSSAAWLVKRLEEEKGKPEKVFPQEFILELGKANPTAGEQMALLTRELKPADMESLWGSLLTSNRSDRFSQLLRPVLLQRFVATPGSTRFFVDRIAKIAPGQASTPDPYGSYSSGQVMITSALSGAARGKPGELDAVAKAVKVAVFGNIGFSETKAEIVDYQKMNFMESMFQQSTAPEALEMVRIQAAFFRLGVPLDDDEYGAIRPFQNKRFPTPSDAEKFLESLGWLSDVDRWEPYVAMLYQRGNPPPGINGYSVTLKPTFALERALQYIRYGGMDGDEFVKRMAERKKGRFGSLMVAAAMSSGKKRSDFADKAFAESASAIGKLPAERIAALALVIPWLSEDAKAKLPEKLRGKMKGYEEKARENAIAQADAFLQSAKTSPFDNLMGQADETIKAILPYQTDKAAAVMIATEQSYTTWLARGGRFSNATTGEWEIPNRDYILSQVLERQSTERSAAEAERVMDFIARLLESPSGKRFALTDYSSDQSSYFSTLAKPLLKDGKNREEGDRIVHLVEVFQARKGKGPQQVVFPAFLLANLEFNGNPDEKQQRATREQLAKLTAKDPRAAALATIRLALWAWARLSPEEQSEARKTCAALMADRSIPDVARMALAKEWLTRIPAKDRFDPLFGGALVKLYQEYVTAGRSAISFASAGIFEPLSGAPAEDDSTVAMEAELARAFWTNAGASNVAGHSPIPSSLAQSAFLAAVLGKDKELVAKTFPKIKAANSERLGAMLGLLKSGQFEFAKQVAPPPGGMFRSGERNLSYTRDIESAIATFKSTAADHVTAFKLGIETLAMTRAEGDGAPVENREAQVQRLTSEFIAAPPTGEVFPWALNALLSRAPGDPKLLALLGEWAKKEPISKFLIVDSRSSSISENRDRRAAVELHAMAAIHALALGDSSIVNELRERIDVPTDPNNGSYYLSQDLSRFAGPMIRMAWADIIAGSTSGYEKGAADFNAFVTVFAKQVQSYDPSMVRSPLALASLLAGWTPDPAALAALCDSLPGETARYGKEFPKKPSFIPFLKALADTNLLKNLQESGRAGFFAKVLTVPNFAGSYPEQIGWVDNIRKRGFKEEIDALVMDPPADTVTAALPEIYEQAGQLQLERKKMDEAMAAFRKGLEACPIAPEFNATRGVLKWKLADVLNTTGKKEEAKKIFLTIPPEEIADWLKDRYEKLAKELDAQPKK